MEKDWELPFDELDPCCQREILNDRRKAEVSAQLRTVDRSERRQDALEGVMLSRSRVQLQRFSYCQRCEKSEDYEEMRRLKWEMKTERDNDSEVNVKDEANSDEEDDDDELLRSLEGELCMTVEEMQRRREMEAQLQFLALYGLAVHREDTWEHFLSLVEVGIRSEALFFPVLLHVYDSSSVSSAAIDVALEEVAQHCRGLRCRRMDSSIFQLKVTQENAAKVVSLLQSHRIQGKEKLLLFLGGEKLEVLDELVQLSSHLCSATTFTSRTDTIANLVARMQRELVNHAPFIRPTPSELQTLMQSATVKAASSQVDNSDDEDETQYYDCGFPGCRKVFFHEHK